MSSLIRSSPQELRAGKLSGAPVVYDPKIQVQENIYALFFLVKGNCIDVWRRGLARRTFKKVDSGEAIGQGWIDAYLAWRSGSDVEVSEKQSVVADKQLQLIDKHKRYAHRHGYLGYRFNKQPYTREPDCFTCGRGLSSYGALECLRCNWVICHECGSCGCGWTGERARIYGEDLV